MVKRYVFMDYNELNHMFFHYKSITNLYMDTNTTESSELIYKDLGIEQSEAINSEEQILNLIADRVRYLLDHDIDLLLSYMYRLDVLEVNINAALKDGTMGPPDMAIAKLILDRQIQRVKTKKKYKVEPIEGWEW